MTASALAHAMDHRINGSIDIGAARALVTQIFRSQIISVMGNLGAVIPATLLIDHLWKIAYGHSLCTTAKALHLLEANHPWHSATAWYAIITGVCLFLSGIVSGYFDNLVDCWHFGERVKSHNSLQKWLGAKRLERYADRLQRNLGSMAGNIFLGVSLALLPFFGQISGLPLDVRHVTLGTGNLMLAASALHFQLTTEQSVGVVLGVALIGTINLIVSFGLSLALAARSRGNKAKLLRSLLFSALGEVARSPRNFFYTKQTPPLELLSPEESKK
jgi:site-specific recombinase